MNQEAGSSKNSRIIPFLFGGLVGAAVGFLLAPKPGSELRKQIRSFALNTKEKISSGIGKGMDFYDDAKIAVTSAVEAGKQAYVQEREKFQAVH